MEFPFLQKAFQKNLKLKEFVFGNYNNEYLDILELLFGELYQKSCDGIDTKVFETSPDPIRFQSLISELEFARYFIKRNMQVQLLSANDFQGRKPPDMHVRHNSKEYFVEVKNIQEDDLDYVLGTKIAEILNSKEYSFMIVVNSSISMATPTYFHGMREEKEKYLQSVLGEFIEKLKNVSINSLPFVIKTTYADIELQKTKKERSYLGIGTMKQAISEPPDYKERIRCDVLQKAEKRKNWIGDELDKFYIVAIADDSLFFYIDRYNLELFGNANCYSNGLKVPKVNLNNDIENAMKNGWEDYLKQMCILQNDRTIIPENERGLFFIEPSTKNITAVLVKHKKNFHVLANPLAEPRISNPHILQELKDSLIGWE